MDVSIIEKACNSALLKPLIGIVLEYSPFDVYITSLRTETGDFSITVQDPFESDVKQYIKNGHMIAKKGDYSVTLPPGCSAYTFVRTAQKHTFLDTSTKGFSGISHLIDWANSVCHVLPNYSIIKAFYISEERAALMIDDISSWNVSKKKIIMFEFATRIFHEFAVVDCFHFGKLLILPEFGVITFEYPDEFERPGSTEKMVAYLHPPGRGAKTKLCTLSRTYDMCYSDLVMGGEIWWFGDEFDTGSKCIMTLAHLFGSIKDDWHI
jgi:hypothetical protein